MMRDAMSDIISLHRPGHALPRGCYVDPASFDFDRRHILFRDWFIAAASAQIAGPGDYRLISYAGESVILVRGTDGVARALLNSCRHRGSRVCLEQAGRARRFTCPYHAWSYDLEGGLRRPPGAAADFDARAHGLKRLGCLEAHGMIFVNFDAEAPDIGEARALLDQYLAPYRLDRTKVAAERRYRVQANWKLVSENFFECYHCQPTHPEFCRTRSELGSRPDAARIADEEAGLRAISREIGLPIESRAPRWSIARNGLPFIGYFRNYMSPRHASMTPDGRLIAPLLGDLPRSDHSETDILFGPNSHIMAYADHAALFQFIPLGPLDTEIVTLWLVRDDAPDDVDVEALVRLWDVTTAQDLRIITANQQGVLSDFYEPGPYMPAERDTKGLIDWYLARVRAALPPRDLRKAG